jgi:coenzyme F420-reducing hydrogenase gamma subunit
MVIKSAWQSRKGVPFDEVEFLNGKLQEPTPGMNKTILIGQCQYNKNKDHPNIKEMIPIRGCPPSPDDVRNAFSQIGIELPENLFKNMEKGAGFLMAKYKGRPEFEESFFQIN